MTEYSVNWVYRTPNSDYRYSEYKVFDTAEERNQFSFNLFAQHKKGEIVLLWVQEKDIYTWENNT